MTGPQVQTCLDCDGRGGDRDHDADGQWCRCEGCDGSGRMVTCMQCGDAMPEPEASRAGAYCGGCRGRLDVSDREAEERELRRSA